MADGRAAYNPLVQTQPSDRYRDLTLGGFVDRLASAEPVPGGGSASAVAASLAAGLVAMVASLSEGRPAYAQHAVLHRSARETGLRLTERLLEIADEDAAAYADFAAAMKRPRSTPDDIAERDEALAAAARHAAAVPLQCVDACLDVVMTAEALAGRSNRNASSDLGVAAFLAEAAARGAAANVLVNLPSVTDEEFAGTAMIRVDGLLHEIGRLADVTRGIVLSGERREPLVDAPAEPG